MGRTYPAAPTGNFLLGNMRDFQRDPMGFLLDAFHTYGDLFSFRIGPNRIFVVSRAELIQDVLVKQASKIRKADFNRGLLSRFLGQGILTSDGDFHRSQRRLVQPAFHSQRIQNYANVMVRYAQDMMDSWQPGQHLNIADEMMRLTMYIVSKTLFDSEVGGDGNRAGEAIAILQGLTVEDFKAGFMVPMWVPTARNGRIRASTRQLDEVVLRFIADRRASGEDRGDLLSMLLLAQDEDDGRTMSDQQVRDEAATLFAAGHETTSNALTWTWYLLSQNPAAEAKLHAELDRVLAGRSPLLADLENLPYTEMVIKEALRLYPPAWVLMIRTPREPLALDGYTINPGEWIFVAPYVTHRNPAYFPDPETFEPERFSPEREAEIPRYAYFPFGGGPRVCIGNSFALMEARLILATVAQRYQFAVDPGYEIVPQPEITLSIQGGLPGTLSAR